MAFLENRIVNENSGSGNQFNAKGSINVTLTEPIEPKGSAIQNLLINILNIEKVEQAQLTNDNYQTYTIQEKIAFNKITIYGKYLDVYKDGYSIVESRIRDLEVNGFGEIRQLIINYVCKKYRLLSCQKLLPDELISFLDKNITDDLKDVYKSQLSLDEIGHVDFVIFHVFAKCEIFDKPPLFI